MSLTLFINRILLAHQQCRQLNHEVSFYARLPILMSLHLSDGCQHVHTYSGQRWKDHLIHLLDTAPPKHVSLLHSLSLSVSYL